MRAFHADKVRRLGAPARLAALLLLAAACGPRVAPQPIAANSEMVATDAAATDGPVAPADPGAPQPTAAGQAPAAPAAPDAGASPGAPAASPRPLSTGPQHNNGVVRIELSAACVTPGSLLVVTLRTPPKAGLGMLVAYADNQTHGAMLTGESDANGVYVWRVPVDPSVPEGEAKVLVSATGPNWSKDGGGSADKPFRVSRRGC